MPSQHSKLNRFEVELRAAARRLLAREMPQLVREAQTAAEKKADAYRQYMRLYMRDRRRVAKAA